MISRLLPSVTVGLHSGSVSQHGRMRSCQRGPSPTRGVALNDTRGGKPHVDTDRVHTGAEPAEDAWLSAEQLAAELGVTTECLTGWITEGRHIPHYQLGPGPTGIRFRRSEIEPLRATLSGRGVEQLGSSPGS